MGILSSLSELCFGIKRERDLPLNRRVVSQRLKRAPRRGRMCQVEALEPREMLSVSGGVPQVVLGSVYFESDSGDDSLPNVLQVSFKGGAAGTTLDKFTINTDKRQDGLSDGDLFFDTAAGGLGAFKYDGLSIVSADGFSVDSVQVVDGGTQIVFNLKNFDAGDKLVFSIDVDEAQFVGDGAVTNGVVDPTKVDTNSLVEGGEFQRSIMTGDFTAPHYVGLQLTGLFWDAFDGNFAAAQTATGETLDLPNDQYSTSIDFVDRTAGAIAYAPQVPLASISGWVYHDRSDDGIRNTPGEEGIGGVTLELLKDGSPTGITTTTSTSAGTLGYYEFLDLQPGNYGVREVQPNGWLDGKDTAGDHGGTADPENSGRVDRITGAVLNYGDHGLNYNFGELLPGSIHGTVQAHDGGECDFDHPQLLLSGVQIDLLDTAGKVIATTTTDANGAYAFTNLAPGTYKVLEHQPTPYFNDDERVGTAGGVSGEIGNEYSFISGIQLGSAVDAINYDFCEEIGPSLSGWVYHDRNDDGNRDVGSEEGIGGVIVQLLDAAGNPTGITTTTSTTPGQVGYYEFKNLAPGTYGVHEIQPAAWLDGKDKPGDHGGVAASEAAGIVDRITGAVLVFGDHAVNYNFGELLPGSIAGQVQAHGEGECDFDNPQMVLSGVTIELHDASGKLIATTQTDENGRYIFTNLRPGQYTVHEIQPANYFSDDERVGTAGGQMDDTNTISHIVLGSAVAAIHYDFCEVLPSSIAGQVQAHGSGDCDFDNPEQVLSGVTIQLLDSTGKVIATTTTDVNGRYRFDNLPEGQYAIHEGQPAGYYSDDTRVGTVGGETDDADNFTLINLPAGVNAIHYDFCEQTPSSIAGQVQAHTTGECNFDDPELVLSGVTIELHDASGAIIDTTITDAQGRYHFDNLAPGEYTVHEIQPANYYSDDNQVGSVGGQSDDSDTISHIELPGGTNATDYDFCEHVGVMLSGNVYHDRSDDGIFDRGADPPEEGIANVVVKLMKGNDAGVLVDTGLRATTDANGFYKFNNLEAGKYAVMEIQPAGWLDGKDTPGNLGGVADVSPPGDMIGMIMIDWGQNGTEYNFGELLPGSIAGKVQLSSDGDCMDGVGETPIAGVQIDLLNEQGQVVGTTFTDQDGNYIFSNLRPGTYSVSEHQTPQYFDLDDHVGDGGGVALNVNLLGDIAVGSDQHWVDYDFCETPPASLSGYVFVDGPPILSDTPLSPDDVAAVRTGILKPGDQRLAGVIVELRDGVSGDPIFGDQAIAGTYPDGPIRAITDANGYYHFDGLRGGTYAVVEIQPQDYIDGLDTPGTLGGYAVNTPGHGGSRPIEPLGSPPPSPQDLQTIEQFRLQYGENAIVKIALTAGSNSLNNNFSEVTIQPPPTFFPPPLPPLPPPQPLVIGPQLGYVPPPFFPLGLPWIPAIPGYAGSVTGNDYTWHLSVIDAGQPRSVDYPNSPYQLASMEMASWQSVPMDSARWTLATTSGGTVTILRNAVFGRPDATPVVGDWTGDGTTKIGVYINGEWYLDLNGDGRWDDGDLWAKLGSRDDLPVTGDWDGDGKIDIGIFGPAWPRDPWAVAHEPGVPDADNWPTKSPRKMKNMPPTQEEATSGARLMKRTAQGKMRADVIDHVFHYGAPGDVPVAGDWNGDGIRSIGVFRDGQWNLDMDGDGQFTDKDASFTFGQAGDIPIVGDFDGDGVDEIGVYRDGKWIIDINHNHQIDAQDMVFELGGYGDKPVVGDWNGDGVDDPGTYQPGVAQDRVSRRAG